MHAGAAGGSRQARERAPMCRVLALIGSSHRRMRVRACACVRVRVCMWMSMEVADGAACCR